MSAGIKWQYVLWKVNAKLNWSVVVQFFMDFVVKRRRSGRLWVIPSAIKKNSNTRSTVLLRYFANKATAWFRRGFHTTLWLSDLLSLCSILFFGRERSFVIIIIFCFVLNCKANNSCSQRRRQRCRIYGYEIQKHTVSMHIRVYRVCCSSCTMQLCILLLQSVWIQTSKL